jgi:basic membrane lipoprotein Med (substrate-binding protein (PBP1-ABC) superfamily)
MALHRVLTIAMAATMTLVGCGQSGLTDAETVWCKANVDAVAASATSLGLPSPAGDGSWNEWATAIEAAQSLATVRVDNPWDALTAAGDRPNRDRACAAAYAAQ